MSESVFSGHEHHQYRAVCTECGFANRFAAVSAPIDTGDERDNWCERCADIVVHRCVEVFEDGI